MAKLLVMLAVFAAVSLAFGRWALWALVAAMAAGMAVLHGWWFHLRHGVHWRTAEPRERYFELIGAKKR